MLRARFAYSEPAVQSGRPVHPESEAALARLRQKIAPGQRIAFVSGTFNVVHPGHLRVLRFAADCADVLVVGVNAQPDNEAVVEKQLRLENVSGIGIVDFAFLMHDRVEDFVAALKPDVVVKGKEHENVNNPEGPVIESYGGQLLFSSGDVVFSSLDLLKREFLEYTPLSIVKSVDFALRHAFDIASLKRVLAKIPGIRVMVIGDVIVDNYIACDALGMSQEDPSIVVTPVLNERFIGGAGIVASHASRLGAETKFISVVGDDSSASFAARLLESYGVDARLLCDDSRPTTLKQRFRADGKTLLRVSYLKQHAIDHSLQEMIFEQVKDAIGNSDLIMFSDFNYGLLPQPLVDAIVELGREKNVPMVADSQSSSQTGDISRFRHMMLLKPTEREARLALRDFDSGLVVLAEGLRRRAAAKNIVLTLGSEGLLIHADAGNGQTWLTDQLPAFNTAPKDTAGAGDSFFVMASLATVAGTDIWQSSYLGSIAAACQVGRIGNIPLSAADIELEIDS